MGRQRDNRRFINGATECILFEGAVDRQMFDEYVKQMLTPQLRPGDIVIMDNLRAHNSALAVEIVQSRQAEIKFLPAYSPDLNPIEKMWSKVKQIIRGLEPRTNQDLFSSAGTALDMVTASDARGWFKSCGYIIK